MLFKNGNKISLIGFGTSNRAMCEHLIAHGIFPVIRNDKPIQVPAGCELAVEDYLRASEDLIFRSPVIRPDRIVTDGVITSEAEYALSIMQGHKIGITGSDGKTTTSTLIYEILRQDGKNATLCGNIGTPIISVAPRSTPDSYTVCELSSFQLMDFAPRLDTCVITGITENHLDWHTDMAEYIEAKRNIIKNASRLVLCYDSDILRRAHIPTGKHVCYFSLSARPHIAGADAIAYVRDGAIYYNDKRIIDTDKIALKGSFNALNAMASICACASISSPEAQESVLRTFSGVRSRMTLVESIGGVSFIDSSIDSTPSRTLATVSAFDKSRCILILGGYDKGLSYDCLAQLKGIRGAVLLGQNRNKILSVISDVCECFVTDDLDGAVKASYHMARDGDYVILSPASASFDMFENYKKRAEKFEMAVKMLKEE